MKTIEQLEAELRDALARERQLRCTLEQLMTDASDFIGPNEDGVGECRCCGMELDKFMTGHKETCLANKILDVFHHTPAPRVFTVDELNDICEIHRTEIANLKEQVRVFESWHKDPRVFTAEEVRPLVEALSMCLRVTVYNIDFDKVFAAYEHARKLGMEGKP